jgi:hypothetical protein
MTTSHDGAVLYFSATIITLDGSATTSDGEPCEAGTGYIERSGWWDPDRCYWRVHDQRADVTPDRYPPRGHRSHAGWLADRLLARLGAIASWEPAGTFYGAREAVHPGRLAGTGSHAPGVLLGSGTLLGDAITASRLRNGTAGTRTIVAAGHAHGFTDADLTETAHLLGLH